MESAWRASAGSRSPWASPGGGAPPGMAPRRTGPPLVWPPTERAPASDQEPLVQAGGSLGEARDALCRGPPVLPDHLPGPIRPAGRSALCLGPLGDPAGALPRLPLDGRAGTVCRLLPDPEQEP